MAMTTRCPQCSATFRVVPDQLRVRSGLVRCGACGAVFDGYAGLVSEAEAAEPPRRNPPAVFRNRADMMRDPEAVAAGPGEDGAWDEERGASGEDATADDDDPPADAAAVDSEESGEDDAGDGLRIMGEQRQPDEAPLPEFLDEDLQRRRRLARRLWAAAALAALALLAAQLLVVYRTAIAAALPAVRPALALLCRPLGCEVGYERRAERISIMSSSLQPGGAGPAANATASGGVAPGAGRLVLNVVLRNRYDRPQPWPALMLDLRDLSDTVVVRKVLLPRDYLPPAALAQPFGAGAEISLAVPLEVAAGNVNGYQLDKFFP